MKYNHQRLLRKMMDDNVPQLKIISYFEGEGYSENDVIREITTYEQEQHASSAMKEMPDTPTLSMEHAEPRTLPMKPEALPATVLMALLVIILIVFLTIGLMLIL